MPRSLIALPALLLMAGCPAADSGYQTADSDDVAEYNKQAEMDAEKGHSHTAPHGGTLIEVGEHQYNVELVKAGDAYEVYVLGAHAEEAVAVAGSDIELELDLEGGEEVELELTPAPQDGDAEGMASKFMVGALPEGVTSLDEAEGHFHLTVNGTEFEAHLGEDHDHEEGHHDHGEEGHMEDKMDMKMEDKMEKKMDDGEGK